MKQKIVVLPIDDRPCHNRHIREAMKNMKDYDLVYPDSKMLGHFTISGDVNACEEFLLQECIDADALVVSIDALLFGGLVQARSAQDNKDYTKYLEKLNVFKRIKDTYPQIIIYAYSVIMRLTTTVTDSNNLDVWNALFKYSQLSHRVKFEPDLQETLENTVASIPHKVLATYLNARQRNHEVNKALVELVHQGFIDYSVLVQEDTSEYGMHIQEQEILSSLILEGNRPQSCLIKNGTDEMVALLIARYINKNSPIVIDFDIDFVDKDFQALYEDRTVLENLNKSMNIACIEQGPSDVVAILTPSHGTSVDYCFEEGISLDNTEFLKHIQNYQGKTYGLLDVKNANGGDVQLLESVVDILGFDKLVAYSAWNTASNAIGSFLLDMTIATHQSINHIYLYHRILDDAYYQGRVRRQLNAWMKSQNIDIWAMNSNESVNIKLNEMMFEALDSSTFLDKEIRFKSYLPWGRSFEIEMEEVS